MTTPGYRDFTRYLSDRSTTEERTRLEEWLDADPAHRALFQSVLEIWELAEKHADPVVSGEIVDNDWQSVHSAIFAGASVRRPAEERAAKRLPRPSERHGERSIRRLAELGVTLRAPDRSERGRPMRPFVRVAFGSALAAVLMVGIWLTTVYLQQREHDQGALALREITTEPGRRARIPLGDGSFVRLNVASTLRYPERFDEGRREVVLEGEAYFEVSEDASRPFVVRSAGAEIRVLGTSFNIRSYDNEDQVDVYVVSGSVAVQATGSDASETVVLGRQELARVSGGEASRVDHDVDMRKHISWLEGRIIFEDTPLRDVAVELRRWYTLEIELADPALADWRLTASFKNESVEEILQVIASSLHVRYERDRHHVTLFR